ncbi:MAG: PAS domain-containing protein [Deltaproteobacteria bacterium]|nr:PAS domain-containing protein [Deltaproteobacteria bacterium]
MKLRIILVVLSLLSFLSVSAAGYIYYSSLNETVINEAEKEIALQAERTGNGLSAFLSENLKSVKALAGMKELGRALGGREPGSLDGANSVLDHFRDALKVDVCYLMDREGNTVASSNRDAEDSFVGKNFSFRPYWQQAIRGSPASYMARGVASNVRGVYSSHPVYREAGGIPIGIVVVKAPIERIEEEFRREFEGIVLLADPNGIVFSSNRKDWVYRSLRRISREEAGDIARTQQFGTGPWEWIGMDIGEGNTATDNSGGKYLAYRMKLDAYPGWNIIYLRNVNDISKKISGPLVRATGSIIVTLCLLIGMSVFITYKMASDDIVRRKDAEEALREAKEELKAYSMDLERQVRERTREIMSILRYTPAVVYIRDGNGRYTYVNSRYEELFGKRNEDILGKTVHDVFPKEFADRYRASDRRVLLEGRPCQVEESAPHKEGVRAYLATKFPIYDESGATIAVCGISIDITEIKKARDQVRRLSDSLLASQERERAAVSRELHDELGQVLTALHLDTVWLRDRLKEADAGAAERAQAMCGLIDLAIDEVRGMATRLRPGVLDNLGLVDALDWYITDFGKRAKIACAFRHHGVPKVEDRIATSVYRIAQEALTNVVRHSGASKVDVSLRSESGILTLAVEDDGKGFDLRDLPDSVGLGVVGMRERAELIGGDLDIRSEPGGGTMVIMNVPAVGKIESPA